MPAGSRAVAVLEALREKTAHAPPQIISATPGKQLPLWPESTRGVPNIALRSALFSATRKDERPYLERQKIYAQNGITILYSGPRLNQGDLDVWETVLHIARVQMLGNECRVNAYQLLKAQGKTDTGKNRRTLDRRLTHMKTTGLDVKVGKYSYEGSLIDEVYRAEESREYVIRLNPKLLALFETDQFTQIEWSIRRALNGKPLAQWLHGYYASHVKPFAVKIATLYRLCGSEAERMDHFRETLRAALDTVASACAAAGQSFRHEIRAELVHVWKDGSASQRRHLLKKAAKASTPRTGR